MQRVKLGQVCEVVTGSTPKTGNESFWDGDNDWITPAELSDDTYIVSESIRKITDEGALKTGLKPFPKGTVILSSRAPIGKVAIAGKTMYCNQGFKNLICSDRIDNAYLYWFLKGRTEYLNSLGRGATFKEISKTIVENIEINLPPLEEQKRNAKILRQCRDIIGLRKDQLTVLDNLTKSRFVEMFGDMTANLNGWEKKLLGEVCDVRDGTHDSPKYVMNDGYPLVTSKNVSTGKIDFTECSLICREDLDKINARSKVDLGDILMPMIGTVGNPVIVDVEKKFAIKNVALIKFVEESLVNNIFVKALLQSDYFDSTVLSKVRGGTQKFISLGDIRKLEIALPPMELQNEFSLFIKKLDKSKLAIQKSLEKTQTLFDALMQQYFG